MAALVVAVTASAQDQVGSVAALEGTAEVLHPGRGAWEELKANDGALLGDQVRTHAASKLKLQLRDESVLTLGPNSQLTLDQQTVAPQTTSSIGLVVGTMRAVVSDRYRQPHTRFEVETPTSIAGVRGTGFVARHDPARDASLYLGLYDTTFVRSKVDPQGRHEVLLRPGEATEVRRGKLPTRPASLPEDIRRQLIEDTELLAGGLVPETELEPGLPAKGLGNAPTFNEPGKEAKTPESEVIDQPIDQLKPQRPQRPPLPPPPPQATPAQPAPPTAQPPFVQPPSRGPGAAPGRAQGPTEPVDVPATPQGPHSPAGGLNSVPGGQVPGKP